MTDPSPPTSAQSLIVATAGHVDHGKSSLVEALTGHDTDTLQEEIARGLTINLGYAYTRCDPPDSDPVWLGFVDVPGHRDFINNMLAGVSAVEGALLVVAVDDGIMPQTREHLDILDLLGIQKAVVALTKIDRGSDERIDERIEEVSADIRALLAATALAGAPIVPVSSLDGRGIDSVRAALLALRSDPAHAHAGQQQRFRFLVDRSFSVKGVGTVVTGTAVAGTVGVGDSVRHSGSGEVCRIRGIRLHDQALTTIGAGQRAALNVTLAPGSVSRGDWLGDPARQHGISRFDGSLRLLDAGTALKSGVHYHLYIGASHRLAHLRPLAADPDSLLRVTCDSPLFIHHGDRFIIRDPADHHTIAGGQVLDCLVPTRHGNSPERIRFLQAQTSPAVTCLQYLLCIPPGVVAMDAFARNRNLTSAAVSVLLDELAQLDDGFVRLTDPDGLLYLVPGDRLERWRQALVDWLESYHSQHPGEQGVADAQLWQASLIEGSRPVCRAAIDHWLHEQVLRRTGSLLHLPAHRPRLGEADRQFMERIQPLLLQAGRVPPRTRELVDLTGIKLEKLEKLLRELTRSGHLVQVADNRHFLPETLLELADFSVELAEKAGPDQGFTVIQFRDASGIGRNLCIEILEYFDGVGFTQRRDNLRLIRVTPARAFRFHPDH